jgi:hypothetical protein
VGYILYPHSNAGNGWQVFKGYDSRREVALDVRCKMDQETRWLTRYNEVKEFIEREHRNPSKHRIEEHDMLNWLKANRKALNAGKLKAERVEKFKELLALTEIYRRKNQWV